jgi:hypothetical protein
MQGITYISTEEGLKESAYTLTLTSAATYSGARPPTIFDCEAPDETAEERGPEDSPSIERLKLEAIAVSLATFFIIAAGMAFTWNIIELIKAIERSISIYMQTQLWIPR